MEPTEQWVRPNLDGPKRYAQDAIKLGPIKLYVVYAKADGKDAKKLLDLLQPHLSTNNIKTWDQHKDLLPGEGEKEKAGERKGCDLTLQLLSPEFQAAGLGADATERKVPVLLHRLADEPEVEVFRPHCRGFDVADARELFLKIRAVLARNTRAFEDDLRALAYHEAKYVDSAASPVSLRRDFDPQQPVTNRCDALTFLNEWLTDPTAPPYCALFGELGMGKTTAAKEFARRLWQRYGDGERVPMAVFLDLRFVGDAATRDPDLDYIVGRILKRDWKGGPRSSPPQPDEIYKLVEQGARGCRLRHLRMRWWSSLRVSIRRAV